MVVSWTTKPFRSCTSRRRLDINPGTTTSRPTGSRCCRPCTDEACFPARPNCCARQTGHFSLPSRLRCSGRWSLRTRLQQHAQHILFRSGNCKVHVKPLERLCTSRRRVATVHAVNLAEEVGDRPPERALGTVIADMLRMYAMFV